MTPTPGRAHESKNKNAALDRANAPLFRDPIEDGAADPVIVYNPIEKAWWMVYTNRRTTALREDGLSWLFGSKLGVASSLDGGASWQYRGTLEGLDFEWGHNTFWAPEIFEHDGTFHMYVSYIRGIPSGGTEPDMLIHHYTSADLVKWTHHGPLGLSSTKVIDACVVELPGGGFRMWYKDQHHDSETWTADSPDLYSWTVRGAALKTSGGHEGPNVFRFRDSYWLIVDSWKGQLAYRSADLENWTPAGTILDGDTGVEHRRQDDTGPGLHADVVVTGDTAWIFYFTHPERTGPDHPTVTSRRSSIQVAQLDVREGQLHCNRDDVQRPSLTPPTRA